ncbi:MAG: NAD(P)/FAD-dependent oxidoreductase [Rubripirellula sp.]
MSQHASIVGGGAVGLSIAWELVRRGLQVSVFDRGRVGQATSWSAAGILPPANFRNATDPIDQLRGLSHQLFPSWVAELESSTKMDCGFRRCGGWYLAETVGERASMHGMTGYWQTLGIECEQLDSSLLASREPALRQWASRTDATAWWTPDECQIRPPRYLQALRAACLSHGVEIHEHSSVTDLHETPRGCEILIDGRWRPSDCVIVCGGAWSGLVAERLRLASSIVPIRGQMLLLKTDAPLLNSVINVGQRYILCRDDGHTLVGSCEEEVGFELGETQSAIDSLRQFACDLVPGLAAATEVKSWSGLRPMTFDGFPMIGRVPDQQKLYVASGHFRSGLHLSPGTATTLADQITGKRPAISLEPFRVGKQQSARTENRSIDE